MLYGIADSMAEWWSPKRYVHILIHRTYVYSFMWPKMGFIQNLERGSLSWTLQVGFNSNDKCPHKTEAEGDLTIRGEVM